MNNLVADLSTILNNIGLNAIFNTEYNYTIVGKEPLKKLTPPNLLNSPDYYKSSHYLQSKYINVEILLSADDNDETVNVILKNIKETFYSLPAIIYKTANIAKLGHGIIQLENILNQYGYTLYLGQLNNKPLIISDIFNETISFTYHKYIFHTHSNIVNGRREDSVGIKIYNTQTHNIIYVSVLYITYKLHPNIAIPEFIPHLSEKQVIIENPIYFNTDKWKSQHSQAKINNIASYLYTNKYLSIPSLIYRLVTEYNYGYGPYMSQHSVINRKNIKTQIDYILKLLSNNEINMEYMRDISLSKDKEFMHFLEYLQNQYPNSPCFDFKTNTNIVDETQIANISIKTINLNIEKQKTLLIEDKEMETILHPFHNLKNPIGKMLDEYILKFGYSNIIREYTNRSANYSSNIISWLYTGNIKFLQKYITPELSDDLISTIKFHQQFVDLFNGLNKLPYIIEFSKYLPETYILYKGVNLFNCKSNNGKYLDFLNLDLSVPNYIYNPLPTSTSSIMNISENFAKNECCLLRIKMHHKYNVLFIPANSKYSSYIFQNEVILPPKSIFLITKVQYVYRSQIVPDYKKGSDMVLLIDCEYKYSESGDELPGFAPDVHEIPDAASVPDIKPDETPKETPISLNTEFYDKNKYIDKPYFIYLAKKHQKKEKLSHDEFMLMINAAAHYKKEYLDIINNKYIDNELNSGLPYKELPKIPEQRQGSNSSKKPINGGKLSIRYRPGTKKRLMYVENNKQTKSAVTFTVIFDDMFADSCCNSATVGDKNIVEALSTMADAYSDPSKIKLDSMARHKAIELEKDYNKHKQAIAGYVKNHPEYKYMLNEQSIQKLAEFYEDINAGGKISIPKSRKSINRNKILQSYKNPVNSKKRNPLLFNTVQEAAMNAY